MFDRHCFLLQKSFECFEKKNSNFSMFSLFLAKVRSDTFVLEKPTDSNALFDLKFHNSSQGVVNLTYKGRGFFLKLNVTDDDGIVHSTLLKSTDINNKQRIEFEGIWFYFKTVPNIFGGFTAVEFTLNNTGFFDRKVSLGVFADCGFNDDDNAPITMLESERGFYVTSGNAYNYTTFVRYFKDYPNANTIYVGDMPETTMFDPNFYPYFMNGTATKTTSDSVYAFSWIDQTVPAEKSIVLGFAVGAGINFNTPPIVYDETQLKDKYAYHEKVPIKCKVVDYDNSDLIKVIIYYDSSYGYSTEFDFRPNENNRSYTFTAYGTAGFRQTPYKCFAQDAKTRVKSNTVEGKYANNQAPTLEITTPPKKEYFTFDKIKISGKITDNKVVKLNYQFNNSKVFSLATTLTSTQNKFEKEIPIPAELKIGKDYNFRFWVNDDFDVPSNVVEYVFTLSPPNAPELVSVFASDPAYIKGHTDMVIFGEVADKDLGQIISIFAKPGEKYDYTLLGNHTIVEDLPPFAFNLDVPSEIPAGLHDFNFYVKDNYNSTGASKHVPVRICEEGSACYAPGEEPISPSSSSSSTSNKGPDKIDTSGADKYKSKMPVVWVLTVLNLIAVIVLLVIGVIYLRKRMFTYDAFKDDTTTEGDEEISESCITPAPGSVSQTVDNPLFSTGIPQSDDVFAEDYHEETTVDVFKFNNDEEDPDLGI